MEKIAKSRPTQKQIADKLGLSAATVSLALRDNPVVAKATRELVQQAMRETGYVRNLAAASLRTGRSNIVGVSVRNIGYGYYGQMLIGIERAFAESGTVVLINNHDEDPEKLEKFAGTLATYGADALLVAPPPGTPLAVMDAVRNHGMPVLYLGREVIGDPNADYVGVDNRGAGRLAVEHLHGLGFDQVYLVGGRMGTSVAQDRIEGFREAVAAGSENADQDFWIDCEPDSRAARDAVGRFLSRKPGRVGLVCYNDLTGAGAIGAARAAGLEPGRDIGIVAIGGAIDSVLTLPSLTTISEDPKKIGRLAAQTVLERLAQPEADAKRIVLDVALQPGESSGAMQDA
jgi:LacI family transcriptional regulator